MSTADEREDLLKNPLPVVIVDPLTLIYELDGQLAMLQEQVRDLQTKRQEAFDYAIKNNLMENDLLRIDAPKNVNSFLYGACWRIWKAMGGKRLITYTLRSESGSSLKGAGWTLTSEVEPCTWDRIGRRRVLQEIQTKPKYRWERVTG